MTPEEVAQSILDDLADFQEAIYSMSYDDFCAWVNSGSDESQRSLWWGIKVAQIIGQGIIIESQITAEIGDGIEQCQ